MELGDVKVKIRPFRYGNYFLNPNEHLPKLVCKLKSGRFGMEIHLKTQPDGSIVFISLLKSDHFGMEILEF